MKVAILLLNRGRGSGVVAKEHAGFLLSQGHEVYFMHPGVGDGVPGAKNIDINLNGRTMPVHEYLPAAKDNQKAVSSMDYEEACSYLPAYEGALEEIIHDVDIVIGHHGNLSGVATASVCKRHGTPYALFLHGTGIEPRHHGLYNDQVWELIEAAIEEADGIIVTTEYVRDHLVLNLVNLPMDRFLIQPCGVDVKSFHPEQTGDIKSKYDLPDNYVICPGALTQVKGPQNVVEASKAYSDLAPTIFIGDGDMRESLETDLGDRGRFLGFVSNEDKAQLINKATVLVAAPEKKEHFGIIYVEAMAGGTPIVAYEGGGVNSIVTEGGVLTDRNPDALGKAVRAILEDADGQKSQASAGRKRAEDVYATEVVGPQLINWLEGLKDRHTETLKTL